MKKDKKISIERGSGLLQRAIDEKSTNVVCAPSKLASDFISRNEQGTLRVFVAGGSRSGNEAIYEEQAFKLGEVIGHMNYRLDFGLSSKGIMGAVAKGLIKSWSDMGKTEKSPIYGITTKEYLALYKSDEVLDEVSKIVVANTLEERKQQLLAADLVIFTPGGVGTLDELVYDCVAMQDGFLDYKPFVLYNVNGFFHHLLEYLKEINLKGFSDPMPFVVVDDHVEAGIAFRVLQYTFCRHMDKKEGIHLMEKIIYELPYIIEQHYKHPRKTVKSILEEKNAILSGKSKMAKEALTREIENAYLSKEIERMYERLAKTGRDTALVSDKLSDLKKRHIKG
ncbi:MAG: LOG family protein [Alphaproteobacteria bacterium]|nr:LOG family protein [Alphaproteobacteria bacterium]